MISGRSRLDAPTTEKPLLGSTEQWDIFNFTADSHPIHLHLTQYQVVEKWHIDFVDLEDWMGCNPDEMASRTTMVTGSATCP